MPSSGLEQAGKKQEKVHAEINVTAFVKSSMNKAMRYVSEIPTLQN